ncbi:MAG: hypothetical protein EOP00_19855 [Pedobacter sp.]|nr:MAG: hypothetical protein EOP00_19855 [Pedobacter sp.]
MKYRLTFLLVAVVTLVSCQNNLDKNESPNFERILTDTTNNYRAKWDLEQIKHYNSICKEIGLNSLYDGVDSFEIRAWDQTSFFGMGTDENIYSIKLSDSLVSFTFYRIFCKHGTYDDDNYKTWDAFTEAKVDSFTAISKTFPTSIIDSLNLQELWNLKSQSALEIPGNIAFTDGSTTSIELATKTKYKLIRHHVAYAYFDKLKIQSIENYIVAHDKIIRLFQTNKIYNN